MEQSLNDNSQNTESITAEHVEFIEQQANMLFDFVLESRRLLRDDAHATLRAIYLMVLFSFWCLWASFVADRASMAVWLPLAEMMTLGVLLQAGLLRGAMRARPLLPKGNSPKNLLNGENFSQPVHLVRLAEVMSLQERIDEAMDCNRRTAASINAARGGFIVILGIGVLLAVALSC